MRSWGLSPAQPDEVWQRWRRGESLWLIARRLNHQMPSVRQFVFWTGGYEVGTAGSTLAFRRSSCEMMSRATNLTSQGGDQHG